MPREVWNVGKVRQPSQREADIRARQLADARAANDAAMRRAELASRENAAHKAEVARQAGVRAAEDASRQAAAARDEAARNRREAARQPTQPIIKQQPAWAEPKKRQATPTPRPAPKPPYVAQITPKTDIMERFPEAAAMVLEGPQPISSGVVPGEVGRALTGVENVFDALGRGGATRAASPEPTYPYDDPYYQTIAFQPGQAKGVAESLARLLNLKRADGSYDIAQLSKLNDLLKQDEAGNFVNAGDVDTLIREIANEQSIGGTATPEDINNVELEFYNYLGVTPEQEVGAQIPFTPKGTFFPGTTGTIPQVGGLNTILHDLFPEVYEADPARALAQTVPQQPVRPPYQGPGVRGFTPAQPYESPARPHQGLLPSQFTNFASQFENLINQGTQNWLNTPGINTPLSSQGGSLRNMTTPSLSAIGAGLSTSGGQTNQGGARVYERGPIGQPSRIYNVDPSATTGLTQAGSTGFGTLPANYLNALFGGQPLGAGNWPTGLPQTVAGRFRDGAGQGTGPRATPAMDFLTQQADPDFLSQLGASPLKDIGSFGSYATGLKGDEEDEEESIYSRLA